MKLFQLINISLSNVPFFIKIHALFPKIATKMLKNGCAPFILFLCHPDKTITQKGTGEIITSLQR